MACNLPRDVMMWLQPSIAAYFNMRIEYINGHDSNQRIHYNTQINIQQGRRLKRTLLNCKNETINFHFSDSGNVLKKAAE